MEKINVLVVNQPRLLHDLVVAILEDQPDIEVVKHGGSDSAISDLAFCVQELKPDFVITSLEHDSEIPESNLELLRRYPNLKIIAVSAHSDNCFLYGDGHEKGIYSLPVVVSEQGILSALRGEIKCGQAKSVLPRAS